MALENRNISISTTDRTLWKWSPKWKPATECSDTSFWYVVRAVYKAPPWGNPPKIILLEAMLLVTSWSIKAFTFSVACLIPDSFSSEPGESPILSNQKGIAMFIFNATGTMGTCRLIHLACELVLPAKASAHPCPGSSNHEGKLPQWHPSWCKALWLTVEQAWYYHTYTD